MAKYGQRHGVTKQAVDRWKREGYLVFAGGKIDPAASDERLKAAGKGAFDIKRLMEAPSDANAEAAAERILSRPGGPENRTEAEFCDAVYRARLRQLEYERESSTVVPVDDVVGAVGAELANVRSQLLALPSQLAPALAGLKTVGATEAALRDAITEVLEALTSDTPTPTAEIFKRIQNHNGKH